MVEPVKPLGGRRLAGRAHQLGHGRLHAVGQLVVGDRRLEGIVMADAPEHALVERAQQLELARLGVRSWLARADVGDRGRAGLEDRPLKRRRQESGAEAIDAAGRNQAAV